MVSRNLFGAVKPVCAAVVHMPAIVALLTILRWTQSFKLEGTRFGKAGIDSVFSIRSLSPVVGSSAVIAEYYSTSKYRTDVSVGCSNEQLIH